MAKDLYLDAEWFLNQKIFVIAWGRNLSDFGQLYDTTLTRARMKKLLDETTGYIYFYGPDIAMIEKYFNIDIRNNYKCVNLLKIFRLLMPRAKSYRIFHLEKQFKIERTTTQYKHSIFSALRDWKNPKRKHVVLRYNMEDVINLIHLKRKIFKKYKCSAKLLNENLLQ